MTNLPLVTFENGKGYSVVATVGGQLVAYPAGNAYATRDLLVSLAVDVEIACWLLGVAWMHGTR